MGCRKLTYCNEVKIPSYRDSQKTTSKTEGTPIFEMGGKQVSDYYLFGMFRDASFSSNEKHSRTNPDGFLDSEWEESGLMPGRHGSDNSEREYRYGFQGQEKDDEVKGEGNSYITHFRQLDPRVGRWLSIDPKASSMPWQSPYISMDNNPIMYSDKYGDSIKVEMGTDSGNKALEMFNNTGVGKEYLAKFAAAGQTVVIGGEEITFDKDGEYHLKGVDLVLSDKMTPTGQGYADDGTINPKKYGIHDDRLKINVNLSTKIGEGLRDLRYGGELLEAEEKYDKSSWRYKQAYNKFVAGRAETLTHDFFIHVESFILDFSQNGKLDRSHQGGQNDHNYFRNSWLNNDVKFYRTGSQYKPVIIILSHTNLYMYEGFYVNKAIHKYLETGVEDKQIFDNMYGSLSSDH